MPEVVRRDLALVAVAGELALRQRHDAGVVDEDVERLPALREPRREGAHRGERREVERLHGERRARRGLQHLGLRLFAARDVAHGEDHLGARAPELERRVETDTAIASGDDDPLAILTRHLTRRPVPFHLV